MRNVAALAWWELQGMVDVAYRSQFRRCGASRLAALRWPLCLCFDYEGVPPEVFPQLPIVGEKLCAI